jgi:hypothetical protein
MINFDELTSDDTVTLARTAAEVRCPEASGQSIQ